MVIDDETLTGWFCDFIRDIAFPCVGAKSALARHQIAFCVADDIRCPADDARIHSGVAAFAAGYSRQPHVFESFVVIFRSPVRLSEEAFETALWARVQALEEIDAGAGYAYDPRVSPDTDNPHFSLSFGGEAFFLIGLHPGASRPARRFDVAALVFNPHDQFERLRATGRYEPLRERILARDVAVSGSENPMLARHGEVSEARQYSGRVVGDGWTCPFQPVTKDSPHDH